MHISKTVLRDRKGDTAMTPGSLGRCSGSGSSRSGERVAQRVKSGGGWRDVSWRALGDEVREVALGLIALGRQPGRRRRDPLPERGRSGSGRTSPILSMGGVTIPVYPTYPPETLAYIVRDSETRTLIVEDERQLEKALAAAAECRALECVVVIQGAAPARRRGAPAARPRLGGAPRAGTRGGRGRRARAEARGREAGGRRDHRVHVRAPRAPRRASSRRTGTIWPRST